MAEPSPYQIAKREGKPYIKLVIDRRTAKPPYEHGGRVEMEGPVTQDEVDKAMCLWVFMCEQAGKEAVVDED